jgi:hypothetical protein
VDGRVKGRSRERSFGKRNGKKWQEMGRNGKKWEEMGRNGKETLGRFRSSAD